jgi:hypothetical protein
MHHVGCHNTSCLLWTLVIILGEWSSETHEAEEAPMLHILVNTEDCSAWRSGPF